MLNETVFAAFALVTINLGLTAASTREVYEKRFGLESIRGRWRMIPFVF